MIVNDSKQSGSALVIVLVLVLIVCFAAAYFIPLRIYADRGKAVTTSSQTATATPADNLTNQAKKPATKKPATEKPGTITLPDGYPVTAAPIYDPSTLVWGSAMGTGWQVIAETSDSLAKTAQTIADTYQALGAIVNQDPVNDKGVGQVAASYGGYGIIATYSFDDDKNVTRISYNVKAQ